MLLRSVAALLALSWVTAPFAADLLHGVPTPIVEPACITDPSLAFQAEGPAPEDRYSLVVRHMGVDALNAAPRYDFGSFAGLPLTGFHVPQPQAYWQRAKEDTDANSTSAFQLQCADAGFFVNAWQFAPEDLIDEGPHAVYDYAFSDAPPAFDSDAGTDLALQVALEVPWLYRPAGHAVVETYLQIRFYDAQSDKFFQMTFSLYNNDSIHFAPYATYARGDSLFVAAPLASNAVVTRSPYSAAASEQPWAGLRFFRAQITQQNFRTAIDLANRYCATQSDVPDCVIAAGQVTPLSVDPTAYRISEFSLITEIFNADTDANGVSVGMHLRALGLYRFR